jgi:hypothetical protein
LPNDQRLIAARINNAVACAWECKLSPCRLLLSCRRAPIRRHGSRANYVGNQRARTTPGSKVIDQLRRNRFSPTEDDAADVILLFRRRRTWKRFHMRAAELAGNLVINPGCVAAVAQQRSGQTPLHAFANNSLHALRAITQFRNHALVDDRDARVSRRGCGCCPGRARSSPETRGDPAARRAGDRTSRASGRSPAPTSR